MIRKKRVVALGLCTAMIIGSLSACGKNVDNDANVTIETTIDSEGNVIKVDTSANATSGSIYEKYYVDAKNAKLTFPSQKRNLIYLSVESLEQTVQDKENGGNKQTNLIPNLTEVQKKGAYVKSEAGRQAYMASDSSWTMAGMVCQTAGIPLHFVTNWMDFNYDAKFLQGAYTIGEVLAANGYDNEYITGCEKTFAGTDLWLTQHGNYEIIDKDAAIKKGYLPEGYNVNKGFEDAKVFEILKKEITAKSQTGKPFNIMASTLDTHGNEEYECDLCDKNITDVREKVYKCSDKQIGEFVKWFEQQPCYANTTLVITGDHINMNQEFFSDCNGFDRTVFNAFVNPAVECKTYTKSYSTMDIYPSTLAALGVKIEGNRLGLGTNIFSDTQTLMEVYGGKPQLGDAIKNDYGYYRDKLLGGEYWDVLGVNGDEAEKIKSGELKPVASYEAREFDTKLNVYDRFYVDPKTAKVTFPEKKKNLIYLSVESLEKTVEDKANGGFKSTNMIPFLTKLQKDNAEVKSQTGLNAYMPEGGINTMMAMVCQNAGVPLMFVTNDFEFVDGAKFLPGAYSLGQILADNGYVNEYITGCPKGFAGTDLWLTQHGNYEIIDPTVAMQKGYIPNGYHAGWDGFEDIKVFEILKAELTEKYKAGKPFNMYASTLDTHGDDSITCALCDSSIESIHERELRCLDSQVEAFVKWFEQQPFYADTVLVIAGDHLSMSGKFYKDEDKEDYARTVYNCYVNAAQGKGKTYVKIYNTMDFFPTTLAAMGVKIEGDRLGLGTNLFSTKSTLTQVYGKTELNNQLKQNFGTYYRNNIVQGDYRYVLGEDPDLSTDPKKVAQRNAKEKQAQAEAMVIQAAEAEALAAASPTEENIARAAQLRQAADILAIEVAQAWAEVNAMATPATTTPTTSPVAAVAAAPAPAAQTPAN